jgi:enamine deaminase RidA (YjgF/YER057c/UK114 family)
MRQRYLRSALMRSLRPISGLVCHEVRAIVEDRPLKPGYPLADEPLSRQDANVNQLHIAHIAAPAGVAQATGYSHVVIGSGRLVAVSGQVALDAQGQVAGAGDATAQARQVFENLRQCLAAAGATFADVVKFTLFVTDIGYLPAIRAVRDKYVDTEYPPASTAVQVVALFRPELLIEVEALALIRS